MLEIPWSYLVDTACSIQYSTCMCRVHSKYTSVGPGLVSSSVGPCSVGPFRTTDL